MVVFGVGVVDVVVELLVDVVNVGCCRGWSGFECVVCGVVDIVVVDRVVVGCVVEIAVVHSDCVVEFVVDVFVVVGGGGGVDVVVVCVVAAVVIVDVDSVVCVLLMTLLLSAVAMICLCVGL